jgi:hypothetical protein
LDEALWQGDGVETSEARRSGETVGASGARLADCGPTRSATVSPPSRSCAGASARATSPTRCTQASGTGGSTTPTPGCPNPSGSSATTRWSGARQTAMSRQAPVGGTAHAANHRHQAVHNGPSGTVTHRPEPAHQLTTPTRLVGLGRSPLDVPYGFGLTDLEPRDALGRGARDLGDEGPVSSQTRMVCPRVRRTGCVRRVAGKRRATQKPIPPMPSTTWDSDVQRRQWVTLRSCRPGDRGAIGEIDYRSSCSWTGWK